MRVTQMICSYLRAALTGICIVYGFSAAASQDTVISLDLGFNSTEIQNAIGLVTAFAETSNPEDTIGLVATDEIVRLLIEPRNPGEFTAELNRIKPQLSPAQLGNFAVGLERSLAMVNNSSEDKRIIIISGGVIKTSTPESDNRYATWGQQILMPNAASRGVRLTLVISDIGNKTGIINAASSASASNNIVELPRDTTSALSLGQELNGKILIAQNDASVENTNSETDLKPDDSSTDTANTAETLASNTANDNPAPNASSITDSTLQPTDPVGTDSNSTSNAPQQQTDSTTSATNDTTANTTDDSSTEIISSNSEKPSQNTSPGAVSADSQTTTEEEQGNSSTNTIVTVETTAEVLTQTTTSPTSNSIPETNNSSDFDVTESNNSQSEIVLENNQAAVGTAAKFSSSMVLVVLLSAAGIATCLFGLIWFIRSRNNTRKDKVASKENVDSLDWNGTPVKYDKSDYTPPHPSRDRSSDDGEESVPKIFDENVTEDEPTMAYPPKKELLGGMPTNNTIEGSGKFDVVSDDFHPEYIEDEIRGEKSGFGSTDTDSQDDEPTVAYPPGKAPLINTENPLDRKPDSTEFFSANVSGTVEDEFADEFDVFEQSINAKKGSKKEQEPT